MQTVVERHRSAVLPVLPRGRVVGVERPLEQSLQQADVVVEPPRGVRDDVGRELLDVAADQDLGDLGQLSRLVVGQGDGQGGGELGLGSLAGFVDDQMAEVGSEQRARRESGWVDGAEEESVESLQGRVTASGNVEKGGIDACADDDTLLEQVGNRRQSKVATLALGVRVGDQLGPDFVDASAGVVEPEELGAVEMGDQPEGEGIGRRVRSAAQQHMSVRVAGERLQDGLDASFRLAASRGPGDEERVTPSV